MLFILRLTDGDCIVILASDERTAQQAALQLNCSHAISIASVRQLDRFGVRFSPTEDGSLEVADWDDAALDDVLASEYPLLYEAYRRANAEAFAKASDPEEPILLHLQSEFERNTEIIRRGLCLERERFSHEVRAKSRASAR